MTPFCEKLAQKVSEMMKYFIHWLTASQPNPQDASESRGQGFQARFPALSLATPPSLTFLATSTLSRLTFHKDTQVRTPDL